MDPLPEQDPFLGFLRSGLERGGFETDDVLAAVLPLFEAVAAEHEKGNVSGLKGLSGLKLNAAAQLELEASRVCRPTRNIEKIQELTPKRTGIEIIGEERRAIDADEGAVERTTLNVIDPRDPIVRPVFIRGYRSWEQEVGHHDPVTDVFLLGQVLASLACGLDFSHKDDLEAFAENRDNLFRVNARIHPVLARVAGHMTELDRHRRMQDLTQIVAVLRNYRDQPVEHGLSSISGYKTGAPADCRRLIQAHLRDRLFEISRRNRLLYFKPSLQTLNLTLASVPLVMDVRNIRLEQLFVWQPSLASAIAGTQPLSLGKYLRFEDAPYIPGVLDKIISEARRDRAEYGFAQLRLVLCFLRWHNLKEEVRERIDSPLLLLPVELTKRKGVRDAYVLQPVSAIAEVNPVLRHHLKTLFGISLPESIDLEETSLDQLHADLERQIRQSEPGVILAKLDRPKIELIHARARQRLDQWRRKQPLRANRRAADAVDYSYDRQNYRPRGLQLFLNTIRPQPFPIGDIAGSPPAPRMPGLVADAESPAGPDANPQTIETTREMYSLKDDESGNPYRWTFDLCSLTLGNFHYRKMTLVRDYAKLVENDRPNAPFDAVFSVAPRPSEDELLPLPLQEQYPVIPCDAAQATAVARARTGRSFIIQGPPGTGKSQTITNLVADFVARGKRVLFVCEKRAAIDVVFHRLRQQGLDELCCLIHDSQDDKRAFILNLKQTYEQWLAQEDATSPERDRDRAISAMTHDSAALERFSDSMQAVASASGIPVRNLLARLIELENPASPLSPEVEEQLPEYSVWLSHGLVVERLGQTMARHNLGTRYSRCPLRWLNRNALQQARPGEMISRALDELEDLLDSLESALELSGLSEDLWDSLPEMGAILAYCGRIEPLATRGQLALIDPATPLARTLAVLAEEIAAGDAALESARAKNVNWKDRLDPTDTQHALEAATRFAGSFTRFFQPAYWRLRRTVRKRYDFSRHAVEPTLVVVLTDLKAEQKASRRCAELRVRLDRDFGVPALAGLQNLVTEARALGSAVQPCVVEFRKLIVARGAQAEELVKQLAALRPNFARVDALTQSFLEDAGDFDLSGLRVVIGKLRPALRLLPDFLPVLSDLLEAPSQLRWSLRHLELDLNEFEGALARKSLHRAYREDAGLVRFDGHVLEAYLERIAGHHHAWLKSNAGTIRARVRRQFRDHVALSNLPATQLSEEQKVFKKDYAAGRRELEHEFGKTMRYKSIRDLAAGSSGAALRDLKPIWLMSPLSVSDTLPLEEHAFDVVIFDEASQIPLEEAIPAIYRSTQVIVVGDEMQLPPTSFFSSSRGEGDTLHAEEAGERFEIDLEADSFLSQSARNLSSTLLAWHYRSRYETLISFSNAAFYGGNLFTIPDRHLPIAETQELIVPATDEVIPLTDALLARSISFHFVEAGVYEHRRNAREASYVAHVVRDLLRRETKLSVGIVAFSEAQQGEIESALAELAEDDSEFSSRLEAEMTREEDDQFCGLFVKNLENVQGDERDVILLSICYGYDREKRMLMNFGPINQRGGEKRLNVIFSRARHHMAVVSSIRHGDITNDYNDGAQALKNFLRYAESLSKGDHVAARSVLENLNPLARRALAPATARDAVIEKIAQALRARGHSVDQQVGQSRFRCDLAVRANDGRGYALGVLVDTDAHYANENLLDRYLTQPGILRAFGWKVAFVLTKDWAHEPERVIDRLERLIAGKVATTVELPEIPSVESTADAPPATEVASVSQSARALQSDGDAKSARAPGLSRSENSTTSPRGTRARRYLELVEGTSKKFWEITVNGTAFTVRFGRIGTAGQIQEKTFSTETEATAAAEELVQSKLRKGYREVQRG